MGGALTKGWANMMASDVFRPDSALFCPQLNPGQEKDISVSQFFFMPDWAARQLGSTNDEIRLFHEFCGRWFGYCIVTFCRLDVNLCDYLYKVLLSADAQHSIDDVEEQVLSSPETIQRTLDDEYLPGSAWSNVREAIHDLGMCDPAKAKAMLEVLEWNADEDGDIEDVLCLDFTYEQSLMGATMKFELCENGADVEVVDDNREEYIMAYCKFLLKSSVFIAMSSFKKGFHSVCPLKNLLGLSPSLLENMLCGSAEITDDNLVDLKTVLVISDHEKCPWKENLIKWFFAYFKSLDQDWRVKMLNFWIGGSRVPAGGFANAAPRIQLSILSIDKQANLPVSHICFNRLDLPPYADEEDLKKKMTAAISMTGNAIQLV